jgi:hypothetical protein
MALYSAMVVMRATGAHATCVPIMIKNLAGGAKPYCAAARALACILLPSVKTVAPNHRILVIFWRGSCVYYDTKTGIVAVQTHTDYFCSAHEHATGVGAGA